jgi:hypothetical protein
MAKIKAPLEIRKAKEELEQEITEILYRAMSLWHKKHPAWTVSDVDLSVIDISTFNGKEFIPATAVVALTKKDGTLTISKHGTVKEMKEAT